jgi:hypothetical protein
MITVFIFVTLNERDIVIITPIRPVKVTKLIMSTPIQFIQKQD